MSSVLTPHVHLKLSLDIFLSRQRAFDALHPRPGRGQSDGDERRRGSEASWFCSARLCILVVKKKISYSHFNSMLLCCFIPNQSKPDVATYRSRLPFSEHVVDVCGMCTWPFAPLFQINFTRQFFV